MTLQELYTDASRWTQHTWTRDQHGNDTQIMSPSAVCWCLSAGVMLCYPDTNDSATVRQKIMNKIGMLITEWNDAPERTAEDILNLVTELKI